MSKPLISYILKADGTEIEFLPANGTDFTLEEAKGAVGGFVEVYDLPDGRVMLMNDYGRDLPQNAVATVLAYNVNSGSGGIVGDVVICPASYF